MRLWARTTFEGIHPHPGRGRGTVGRQRVLHGEAIVMRSAERCDFETLRSRQGQAEAILVAYERMGRTCALSH